MSKINKCNKQIETDDKSEVKQIKTNGVTECYTFKIYRKNKRPIEGKFSRDEMNFIYRAYSHLGSGLTQKEVARYFTQYSLIDFKRILRAFNITKASGPFAPHMYEEFSTDELREIQVREKENDLLIKCKEKEASDNAKLLKEYAIENLKLKEELNKWSNFNVKINKVKPYTPILNIQDDRTINIYLSDMHVGARVNSGSLYDENIVYDDKEIIRRLFSCIDKICKLGVFNTINLVLMGDGMDCCGHYGKTYKMQHDMPECMDVREQINSYITNTIQFISSLYENCICNTMNIYAVPEGNHDGPMYYVANKAVMNYVNGKYPYIKTTIFEKFYGVFEVNDHKFIICHGRDSMFMLKGLPLNLTDNSKNRILEYLFYNNIDPTKSSVHLIKGDLHSSNLNTCKAFTYRNVLSLFGASDYSNMNYSRNDYGVSYDIINNNELLRGDFINL